MIKKSILFAILVIGCHGQVLSHSLTHQGLMSRDSCQQNSNWVINELDGRGIASWSSLNINSDPNMYDDNCSIYSVDEDSFCGEIDHFMMAAQATINYCMTYGGRVPVFLGPATFTQAQNEDPVGQQHHSDYDLNQGIRFTCLLPCSTPGESNDANQ